MIEYQRMRSANFDIFLSDILHSATLCMLSTFEHIFFGALLNNELLGMLG